MNTHLNMNHSRARMHTIHTLFAVVAIVAMPSAVLAGGGEAHIENWWNPSNVHAPALGWMILMFLTFLGVIYYFANRPFKIMLQTRHEKVKKALEQASEAKAQAEATKAEYEARLEGLDEEISAIINDFKERGEQEKARFESMGKAAAERIQKDAVDTIAAEQARAEKELRLEASRIAIELAEQKIKEAMNSDDETRIKNEFLRELSH